MQRLLNQARYLVLIAVVGLMATTVFSFLWAVVKTAKLVEAVADGGWSEDTNIAGLLEVIDMYLLAIVQLIVAIGLYELFIGDLDVPDWLEVSSLDDLKKSLIDVLIVLVAIKGVEKLTTKGEPMDVLVQVGAVALLIVALTFFRSMKGSALKPPAKAGTPADPA